jgi:hypothetical protein
MGWLYQTKPFRPAHHRFAVLQYSEYRNTTTALEEMGVILVVAEGEAAEVQGDGELSDLYQKDRKHGDSSDTKSFREGPYHREYALANHCTLYPRHQEY